MKKVFKKIAAGALAAAMMMGMAATAVAEGYATAPTETTSYGGLTGWIDSEDRIPVNEKRITVGSRVGNYTYFKDNTDCKGKKMSIRVIGTIFKYSDTSTPFDKIDATGTTACSVSVTHREPYMGYVIYGVHQVCDGTMCWATYSMLRDPV